MHIFYMCDYHIHNDIHFFWLLALICVEHVNAKFTQYWPDVALSLGNQTWYTSGLPKYKRTLKHL